MGKDLQFAPRNPSTKEILGKGVALQHLTEFVRSRFGEEAWLTVYGDLKPPAREIFSGRILASLWYPYNAYAEALDIVVRRFLGGRIERAREVGAYDLEASLNSVYRMLYRVGSPAFIVRMSSLLWRSYFNVGRMVVEVSGRGFAKVRIEDFIPPTEAVCYDIFGSMRRGLELSGASSITAAHTDCPLRGQSSMRYEATWLENE